MRKTDPIPAEVYKTAIRAPISRAAKLRLAEMYLATNVYTPVDLVKEASKPSSPLYPYRKWINQKFNSLPT